MILQETTIGIIDVPIKKKRKGKIIVFIGLPASGKSTEARMRLVDGNVMRVNRDDIRNMLFNHWKGKKEQVVTEIETAAVRAAVSQGYDIIIDDTNLHPATRTKWKTLADQLGVVLVEEVFNTSLNECIDRDFLRSGKTHVGRAVIENMALSYGLIPKLEPEQNVVIFDVDGTLADSSPRVHYVQPIEGEKKNHKAFLSEVGNDLPRQTIVDWLNACYDAGDICLIVSGRTLGIAGDSTEAWLHRVGAKFHHLFMRAANDFRDDTEVKQDILDKLLKWIDKSQILFAVDDRKRICDMWRKNGITVYCVAEDGIGDF